MSRPLSLLLLLTLSACTNPLELGERRYPEGDRVPALEIWKGVRGDSLYYQTHRPLVPSSSSTLPISISTPTRTHGWWLPEPEASTKGLAATRTDSGSARPSLRSGG